MTICACAVIGSIIAYYCIDCGVFETEPTGVIEIRKKREQGESVWLEHQVAWLRINDTHINYPVMQADNNSHYLSHDYYDQPSVSGAIFLDYRNSADFSDYLSIIYGHRMNGNLMFSDVAKFANDEYFTQHLDGELELRNVKYRLRVIAYRDISVDALLYRKLFSNEWDFPVITLSTCSREIKGNRNVLVLRILRE